MECFWNHCFQKSYLFFYNPAKRPSKLIPGRIPFRFIFFKYMCFHYGGIHSMYTWRANVIFAFILWPLASVLILPLDRKTGRSHKSYWFVEQCLWQKKLTHNLKLLASGWEVIWKNGSILISVCEVWLPSYAVHVNDSKHLNVNRWDFQPNWYSGMSSHLPPLQLLCARKQIRASTMRVSSMIWNQFFFLTICQFLYRLQHGVTPPC